MRRLFQPFLLLLATATDRELARQLQFLKVENDILRAKFPRRIAGCVRWPDLPPR